MSLFKTITGAAAILATLAFTACGSAPEPTATTQVAAAIATPVATATPAPVTLTHEKFVSRLDALCKRSNRALKHLDALWDFAIEHEDLEALAGVLDMRAPFDVRFREGLDRLSPPPEDAAPFARYRTQTQSIDALIVKQAKALRANDFREYMRLDEVSDSVQAKRTETATGLGLVECGS